MGDLPDPMSQLAQAAAQLHELYAEYVKAGFTPDQSLRLVIAVLQAGAGGQSG